MNRLLLEGESKPEIFREKEYLVCYDISDAKRRRQIANYLSGKGFRIQESVFKCYINDQHKQKFFEKLEHLAAEEHVFLTEIRKDSNEIFFGTAPEIYESVLIF